MVNGAYLAESTDPYCQMTNAIFGFKKLPTSVSWGGSIQQF